ncbi:autoinducer 2 ABC transporter substrate-binding protein [Terribacillus saccharophilus]|uniref:autoinducer 2 ABC transporter substrate-binding protein n=1 Tax=Terribacillus saccharophilus TaxID=361277 RepID=UPI002989D03C|nr:autoinducer 2 ABC transporter substrate-binding protein [Terribacillus saccharophilus]MCM3224551.1 autoinducer 2 ABC transporter substrate-binding protein [Terribacillus saccharophilus]
MQKKSLVLLILLIFVSACNKKEILYVQETPPSEPYPEQTEQIDIAIVPKVMEIPYFQAVQQGVEEAAKSSGATVHFKGPTTADPSQQEEIIRTFIKEKVDVLAVSVIDPDRLSPVLAEARRQGITVLTWDADAHPEARDYFINMVDAEMLGEHLLDSLAAQIGEEGEYIILSGSQSSLNQEEWLHWIKQHNRAYYPNLILQEVAYTNDNPVTAYQESKRVVKAYPDLKGIIGIASLGPPAAAAVLKEENVSDDIVIVGLASPRDMNEHLKEGDVKGITLWSPKKLGFLTVMIAKLMQDGTEIEDGMFIEDVGRIQVKGEQIIMGEPIDFTADNVDQYDF